VRLTATASDPDGDELTYAWSAPEGSFSGGTDEVTARWRAPAEAGSVMVRVRVSDGNGGSASAEVTVDVTNRPPAFESSGYAFDLRENLDGSRRAVDIGTAAASDPDGDALTWELASGDRERFSCAGLSSCWPWAAPGMPNQRAGRGGAGRSGARATSRRSRASCRRRPATTASCRPATWAWTPG